MDSIEAPLKPAAPPVDVEMVASDLPVDKF